MTEATFEKFFDDAAVFPPGLAPLERAVDEHIRRAADPVASRFVGPLVLPVGQVEKAIELAGSSAIDINVVGPAEQIDDLKKIMSANTTDSRVVGAEFKLGSLEAPEALKAVADFASENSGIEVYLELPYEQVTDENLDFLAQHGINLKFRTGGVTADLFPSDTELVDVIDKALHHELAFKFTAGLHRAMRYTDEETGFDHFGFANIGAAIDTLQRGGSRDDALAALNSTDSDAVSEKITAGDTEWREAFRSFGTCSVPEPTGTLRDLGLMRPETVERFEM